MNVTMKLNRNHLKYTLYTAFALTVGSIFITACSDRVDGVEFDVHTEGNAVAGEPVTFVFDGNPDYIAFYSGTEGNSYANRNRTNVDLESMSISYVMTQRYTTRQDFTEPIMHIMVSEDFNGQLTPEAIAEATWTELSAQADQTTEEQPLPVPNPDAIEANPTGYARATNIDFSDYCDRQFYLAFRYLAPVHPTNTQGGSGAMTTYRNHPRVDVDSLCLTKITATGETVLTDDMLNDWGFSTVFVNSTTQTTYTISTVNLLFQPQNDHCDDKVEVWMISQLMDPTTVEPDRGTAIKPINSRLSSYQYTYTDPGTYTATFIATNANMWDSEQTVRNVQVTVQSASDEGTAETPSEDANSETTTTETN